MRRVPESEEVVGDLVQAAHGFAGFCRFGIDREFPVEYARFDEILEIGTCCLRLQLALIFFGGCRVLGFAVDQAGD